jgi:hypothetical protein
MLRFVERGKGGRLVAAEVATDEELRRWLRSEGDPARPARDRLPFIEWKRRGGVVRPPWRPWWRRLLDRRGAP